MVKAVILVVEDEPLVRLFASEMIEGAGFDVLQAANSTMAIATLEDRLDIRVVFTDVDMPGGVSGIKLAVCIQARWPTVQIIVTSRRPWPADEPVPARVVFFPKPYRQDQVIDNLRGMAA